jgi:hypothetical protein
MIYLSGVVRPEIDGSRPDLGLLLTRRMGNIIDLGQTPWAADNGCFAAGEAFVLDDFLEFLERWRPYRSTCLFAVAPDVLCSPEATWERSRPVLPQLRQLGYPAALVAQDGIEQMPIEWSAFDVLFLGGSTRWKLSHHARDVALAARCRGKPVHMGRVNSERRLRTAAMWGCRSVDGTFLRAAPDVNLPRMIRWLDKISAAPSLVFAE